MKRSLLSLLVGLSVLSPTAQAFVVSDIRIDGLQRVSAGTVFNALPLEVGDNVQQQQVSRAMRALYETGYFNDIQLARDGDALVITVLERPSISTIEIEGNKAIKTEDLMKGLKQAGLSEGEIFQQATLESIRKELERQYVTQGRYSASIVADIEAQPRNRVKLKITVDEGEVATIGHVNIVGAKSFPKGELLDLFSLKETAWYKFFGSSDKYSREKLAGDMERLRSYYLDRGFINFDITSTQVSISPDKEHVYILVNVEEGDQYTVSDVKLAGDLIIPEAEAMKLVTAKANEVYSRQLITETEQAISRQLGVEGYTFAKVRGIPKIDNENKTVELTFFVDPGRRAYVRRINFSGNTKTDDEVLRREMRQMEGSSANTQNIEQSKLRLERLGFFKGVNVETVPVPGTTDQVDVNFAVEEQPSGSVTASIGYSQSDGLLLGGSISQNNFLGTGNRVSIGLNKSDVSQMYNFDFLDPYYTVDGVSRGFDVYYRKYDYEDSDISSYAADTYGGNVRFGYPLSETQSINFSVGVDGTDLKGASATPVIIQNYIKEQSHYTNFQASIGWSQSALNRGMLPTAGYSQSLSLNATVPGSTATFFKAMYRGQFLQPLLAGFVGRVSTKLGYGRGYGDTHELPFFENFYAGGFGSIRGYVDNSLGPKAPQADDPNDLNSLGGDFLFEGTVELIFPLPFIKDQRMLRTSLFFDYGNVFDTSCPTGTGSSGVVDCYKPSLNELRYSTGVGLTWITPMGPLSFSWAKALNNKGRDETQSFQFSLGTPF